MLDAANKIDEFTRGLDAASFAADAKSVFAVVRALQILGEGAKKIPAPIQRRYPGIPWRSIAGMRNKLIHKYFNMSLEVVWKTVQDDLPELKKHLLLVISDLES
jgi:uncharacterized protein with HEPN domain